MATVHRLRFRRAQRLIRAHQTGRRIIPAARRARIMRRMIDAASELLARSAGALVG